MRKARGSENGRQALPAWVKSGEQLENVPDVHHDEERWVWLGSRQGADMALGLAAGFHGVIPGAGTAHGLGRLSDKSTSQPADFFAE